MSTLVLPRRERVAILEEVRDYVRLACPDRRVKLTRGRVPDGAIGGTCLQTAAFACKALMRRGLQPLLQAGSASWPTRRPDQDDGQCNTHFSYVFSPDDPEVMETLRTGRVQKFGLGGGQTAVATPEMHCWVVLPSNNELIDLTTGEWPMMAACHGEEWPGDPPPDYLWCPLGRIPERVYYAPHESAIRVALLYISDLARRLRGEVAHV